MEWKGRRRKVPALAVNWLVNLYRGKFGMLSVEKLAEVMSSFSPKLN